MADTQTQEPVAQPMQQETMSALDKARAADTRQVTVLNAIQAYDELEQFGSEAQKYTRGALEGQDYFNFKFRGSICTVTPQFKEAVDNATLLTLTATPTVFTQDKPDPNNAGKTKEIIAYGWSLSFSDITKRKKANAAMSQAFEVTKEQRIIEKKMQFIESVDLSELISDDDMKQLMTAAGA